jgi:hypothetical protein
MKRRISARAGEGNPHKRASSFYLLRLRNGANVTAGNATKIKAPQVDPAAQGEEKK